MMAPESLSCSGIPGAPAGPRVLKTTTVFLIIFLPFKASNALCSSSKHMALPLNCVPSLPLQGQRSVNDSLAKSTIRDPRS